MFVATVARNLAVPTRSREVIRQRRPSCGLCDQP